MSSSILIKSLIILAAIAAFILIPESIFAQPAPPGGGTPSCWPSPCIPIDGGIGFLIAAGLAYGGKKAFDARREGK